MAARNSVKIYAEESYYHIYNRGVEKRRIFTDKQDYSVFLSYLKTYLSPKNTNLLQLVIMSPKTTPKEKEDAEQQLHLKNYSEQVELLCYALLPNHFHLLIKQHANVINHFMNSLGTRYGMFFNRKHKRNGVLFEDVYKAVLVETDEQLIHLSRYIHLNPKRWFEKTRSNVDILLPCSLPEYLSIRQTEWIKTHHILGYFSKTNQYKSYENFLGLPGDDEIFAHLALDYDND